MRGNATLHALGAVLMCLLGVALGGCMGSEECAGSTRVEFANTSTRAFRVIVRRVPDTEGPCEGLPYPPPVEFTIAPGERKVVACSSLLGSTPMPSWFIDEIEIRDLAEATLTVDPATWTTDYEGGDAPCSLMVVTYSLDESLWAP